MERLSFKQEDAQRIAEELDSTILRTIPTRRGSALIISNGYRKQILKIANLGNNETEQHIMPARSWGINNEASILRDLPTGIAPALEAFSHDDTNRTIYSATEYIDGIPAVCINHSLPPEKVIRGLIAAVHHLHLVDILHGDIQPENVLFLRGDGNESQADTIKGLPIDFELSVNTSEPVQTLPGLYHYRSPDVAAELLDGELCTLSIAEETFCVAASALAIVTKNHPVEYRTGVLSRSDRLKQIAKAEYSTAGALPDYERLALSIKAILETPAHRRPSTLPELEDALNPVLDLSENLKV